MTDFKVGDRVLIAAADGGNPTAPEFIGMYCTVVTPGHPEVYLEPETDRPDGRGRLGFFWAAARLIPDDPPPDSMDREAVERWLVA